MPNTNNAAPVVNPGPNKDVWDAALNRSGINPDDVAEYNTPEAGDVATPLPRLT